MPVWLAPLFLLPIFAFPRHRLTGSIPVVLIVLTVANESWMTIGRAPDTVTIMALQIIATGGLLILGTEKGWIDSSKTGRAVMAGCCLFGISLYYVLFPYIFKLGIYPLAGLAFFLITVLPLLAGWARQTEINLGE